MISTRRLYSYPTVRNPARATARAHNSTLLNIDGKVLVSQAVIGWWRRFDIIKPEGCHN